MPNRPSPAEHQAQVEAYLRERPRYETYAAALKRVLERACAAAVPERVVESRAKTTPSFAEKCIRKWGKYHDPVHQLTDLCGARVIVQTLGQVKAVKLFIEHNFTVVERDEKGLLLGEDKFGYRDMHYLVRLRAERAPLLGFTPEEIAAIGERIAEVQVRSLVQHAWADILHDRTYKAPLKLSTEARRTGALLAALMEDGDLSFDRLAGELDGMFANYSAYVTRENLENEIQLQELLLANAAEKDRPRLAVTVARLIAGKGEWARIAALLDAHQDAAGPLRPALRFELGHALCRLHRAAPESAPYRQGQEHLRQVIAAVKEPDLTAVPDLRRNRSLHARALARLGWSMEPVDADAARARDCYRRAAELEPANPYHLADMLGFELKFAPNHDVVAGFRAAIRAARAVCHQHGRDRTELPAAFFTAARLGMLLGEPHSALNDYACGIRHWLGREGSADASVIADEISWLLRIHPGRELPEEFRWARETLELALQAAAPPAAAPPGRMRGPVLVVAGGATTLRTEQRPRVLAFLREGLDGFGGTIISGGTTVGVPGCVGEAADALRRAGRSDFRLLGYIPRLLPHDAPKDDRYEAVVSGADTFSPAQVLHGWRDVFAAGIKPGEVLLFGFGGGRIAAFEYRLALALGATAGVVMGSGAAAGELLADPLWSGQANLLPLPPDAQTVRAFIQPDGFAFEPGRLEEMAQEFHSRYQAGNLHKMPAPLRPWPHLPPTYQAANREQAAYAVRILEAAGFRVRPAAGVPVIFSGFTPAEIESMAELEHGRWNMDRLRDGWRPGPRDDKQKLHDCLVPWTDLPDGDKGVKKFDRAAVAAFPEILAKAGLEVYRP